MALAEVDIPSALLELPSHLLHLILQHLADNAASLVAAGRSCRSLLAAVSDARLWPTPTQTQTGLLSALSSELALAALLPPPLIAARLSFSPHSRFQASLTLNGLCAALAHTHPQPDRPPPPSAASASASACPAHASRPGWLLDSWILSLASSPTAQHAADTSAAWRSPTSCFADTGFAESVARRLSRARGVACARPEAGIVRFQLHSWFVVESVRGVQLQAAPPPTLPIPDWDWERLVPLLGGGVRGVEERARRLARGLFAAPAQIRAAAQSLPRSHQPAAASASAAAPVRVAADAGAAEASLALAFDSHARGVEGGRGRVDLLRSAQLLADAAECFGRDERFLLLGASPAGDWLLRASADAIDSALAACLAPEASSSDRRTTPI